MTDSTITLIAALLDRSGWPGLAGTIVVDLDPDVAVERLIAYRGFDETDARNRIANQASRDERLALADFVVDNGGDLDRLEREVDRAWDWIATLR